MDLNRTVSNIRTNCNGNAVNVGMVVDCLEEESLGILLLIPSVAILLPISFIPGFSSLCAAIVLFAALQALLGRKKLWLPERIRGISVNSRKLQASLAGLSRMADRMDNISKPRMTFMTTGLAQKAICLIGVFLAASSIFFSLLPLIDIVCMAPVIFFGLGLCTSDGLITVMGWMVTSLIFVGTVLFI